MTPLERAKDLVDEVREYMSEVEVKGNLVLMSVPLLRLLLDAVDSLEREDTK